MAFYGYDGDAGEYTYNINVSYNNYDDFPIQYSTSYSSYGYNNIGQIAESSNYNNYYTSQLHQELSYNVHNFSESKIVQNGKGENSYSTKEDDTFFEEYDPTPYNGGYDIAQTYGKPLLPSNETCYPRSVPLTSGHEFFDYGSTPSPYMKHDEKMEEPLKDEGKSLKEEETIEKPRENVQQDQDFEVGNNGTIGEYGYDYGGKVQEIIPYGSGLETMDICESLFGYWPCLEKQKRRRNINNDEDSCNELWENTANYIFGNPFGYGGERRDERYGNYGYYNHNHYYQEQG